MLKLVGIFGVVYGLYEVTQKYLNIATYKNLLLLKTAEHLWHNYVPHSYVIIYRSYKLLKVTNF